MHCPYDPKLNVGSVECGNDGCWANSPRTPTRCLLTEAGRVRAPSRDVARWLGVSAPDAEAELDGARARMAAWLRVCEVAEDRSACEPVSDAAFSLLCARLPLLEAVPNFSREDAARVVTRCPGELRALLAHRESSL